MVKLVPLGMLEGSDQLFLFVTARLQAQGRAGSNKEKLRTI